MRLLSALPAWLGRRGTPAILITGSVCLLLYVGSVALFPKANGRIVIGDATHHFVQLRSLVYDRDLQFQNEYIRIYGLEGGEVAGTEWVFSELTPTGHVRNYMPIGPALLWAPLYLLLSGALWLGAQLGWTSAPDGFERALQAAPGITGVVVATMAAVMSWRLAARFADVASATWAVAGIWLGSHALYYTLVSPAYSHAASMFTGALFFSHWIATREDASTRSATVSGALAGFAALMRWQDAVFLIVPAIEILRWRARWTLKFAALGGAGAAWLLVFSPQLAVWHVIYGRAFTLPQGPSFMEWTGPNLFAVLFSDNHGLFSWSPVLVVALAGLVSFMRRVRPAALPIALVLLVSWYVNASVADWWAGEAYGARRFLSLFPLFVLGLSTWLAPAFAQGRHGRVWIVAALIGLNGLLLLQYQVFMKGLRDVAPYPRGWIDMWLTRFVVPFRLLGRWLG